MFAMKTYKGDALTITDEQVSADWSMGLLRALGKVATDALPADSTGSYGGAEKGSNREHVIGGNGQRFCPLVEIYDVKEERGARYNFDSIGGGKDDVMILKANASCACGRLVKHPVSLEIEPGQLISRVANADPANDDDE